ncbi:MAG TPA: hypothetical protein DCE23_04415 [Firmicutes bacterium]|nr:hypothetical protein [Bacillota bacterium]
MKEMFPDTITIYNIDSENNYHRKVVDKVYYHVDKIITPEAHGEKYTSVHRVIFSNESLKSYINKAEYYELQDKINNFTLNDNDIIVLGEYKDIDNLEDIYNSNFDYFTIKTISINENSICKIINNIEVTD